MKDEFGRPMDDLDILRLRIAAKSLCTGSFSVEGMDGRPITGFIGDGDVTRFVAIGFTNEE